MSLCSTNEAFDGWLSLVLIQNGSTEGSTVVSFLEPGTAIAIAPTMITNDASRYNFMITLL